MSRTRTVLAWSAARLGACLIAARLAACLLATVVLAAAAAAGPARALAGAAVVQPAAAGPAKLLAPCRLPGWKEDVLCGECSVFENRAAARGRKIRLEIVVLPARAAHPQPDPVFYFAGGPGGSAVETVTRAGASYLARLRADRDLVFVDQRGTGGSNPLRCDGLWGDTDDMASVVREPFRLDAVRDCRDALAKVADLRLYSTAIAMEDLDEVRAALGYDKINLYGGSYGSTAALFYLRQHPERVRTATLLGVAPPDLFPPLSFAKGVQNALDILVQDCAGDPDCHAAFPNLAADCDSAFARVARGPVSFDAVNPLTGKSQSVVLPRWAFAEWVRLMLYSPETTRWLPLLLHQSAQGDFASFTTTGYQVFRAIDAAIARGMHFSVVCSENIPFITDADIAREMTGSRYGDERVLAYRRIAALWPRSEGAERGVSPVSADAPVLLLSGAADPVTPPWFAAAAARHLPNSKHVIIPHEGHSFHSSCVDSVVTAFVATGSVRDLDVTCLERARRGAFVTEAMLAALQGTAAADTTAQQIWQGVLEAGPTPLHVVLHLSRATDGKLRATLDSPDQGATGLPVSAVSLQDSTLHFEMPALGAAFDGRIDATGRVIDGQWQQSGVRLPLRLARGADTKP